MKLNLITLALITAFIVIFARHAFEMQLTPQRIAGLAIAISSFLLLALARFQLGRAFSIEAKASTLVTKGLYSRIRNPIYVFGALMLVGIILFANRPWLFLFFAVLIPLQVYRVRKEERALTEKFGDAYLKYKQKTWF